MIPGATLIIDSCFFEHENQTKGSLSRYSHSDERRRMQIMKGVDQVVRPFHNHELPRNDIGIFDEIDQIQLQEVQLLKSADKLKVGDLNEKLAFILEWMKISPDKLKTKPF